MSYNLEDLSLSTFNRTSKHKILAPALERRLNLIPSKVLSDKCKIPPGQPLKKYSNLLRRSYGALSFEAKPSK